MLEQCTVTGCTAQPERGERNRTIASGDSPELRQLGAEAPAR
jgi:hypothetical protein